MADAIPKPAAGRTGNAAAGVTKPAGPRASASASTGGAREAEGSNRRAKAREGRRGLLRPDARARTVEIPMHRFEHDVGDGNDTPSGSDLLAEAELSVRAINEILRGGAGAE